MYISHPTEDIIFEAGENTIEIQTHNFHGDECDITLTREEVLELVSFLQDFLNGETNF